MLASQGLQQGRLVVDARVLVLSPRTHTDTHTVAELQIRILLCAVKALR